MLADDASPSASIPNNCFVVALRTHIAAEQASKLRLWRKMAGYIVLPLVIAVGSTLFVAPLMTHAALEVFFADLLKLTSLGSVATHTIIALTDIKGRGVPTAIYKSVSIYLIFVAVLLAGHAIAVFAIAKHDVETLTTLVRNQQMIHQIIYHDYTEIIIAALSSAYLLFFVLANYRIIRAHSDDIGILTFTRAFLYGANLPFIIGMLLVFAIVILLLHLGIDPNSFLVGSITFLVFSSMAASVCVDLYARPFLATHDDSAADAAKEPCYAKKS